MNTQPTIKNFVIIILPALITIFVIFFLVMPKVRENRETPQEPTTENQEVVIPEKCESFKDDIYGLFSCTVDSCWCDEVLAETGEQVSKKEDAIKIVSNFLDSVSSEYVYNIKAVKLNDLFYNVFSYDENDNEKALTISFDGKILETVCGI